MKITVLLDNHTFISHYYLGEPGASYLIEDGETTLLFDTGYSDIFLENARRLGIDLTRVNQLALSHGHHDHTGGLPAFFERFSQPLTLTAHPHALVRKRGHGHENGAEIGWDDLPSQAARRLSTAPVSIGKRILWLGEIPRVYSFEEGRAWGEYLAPEGDWVMDALLDDTSLALVFDEGVFVITGCAHAGVCNTVAYAKQVTNKDRVLGLIGGFHLFETGEALDQTIETLKALGVEHVWPGHCTSLKVKAAFVQAFEADEVGVGLTIPLD